MSLPIAIVIELPLEKFSNIGDDDGTSMSTNSNVMTNVSTDGREENVLTGAKNFFKKK